MRLQLRWRGREILGRIWQARHPGKRKKRSRTAEGTTLGFSQREALQVRFSFGAVGIDSRQFAGGAAPLHVRFKRHQGCERHLGQLHLCNVAARQPVGVAHFAGQFKLGRSRARVIELAIGRHHDLRAIALPWQPERHRDLAGKLAKPLVTVERIGPVLTSEGGRTGQKCFGGAATSGEFLGAGFFGERLRLSRPGRLKRVPQAALCALGERQR